MSLFKSYKCLEEKKNSWGRFDHPSKLKRRNVAKPISNILLRKSRRKQRLDKQNKEIYIKKSAKLTREDKCQMKEDVLAFLIYIKK